MTKFYSAFIAVVLSLCMGSQASFGAEKIRLLLPQRNIDESIALFPVAKYLGYFEQEGLDVDILAVGGSNEVAVQIASGNGDIGEASPAQAVIGMQKNASAPLDLRYFYDVGYTNIWSISVPADSSIKSIAELRGKKIGVSSLGSAGLTYGKAYIRSAGLNPDTDVTFIPIGTAAQAVTAVQHKVVDAIVFWDTANLRWFEFGGVALRELEIGQKLKTLPDVSLVARNDVIRDKPKMLIGFGRATSKALDFTIANPTAAALIVWKMYPEGRPKAYAKDPQKALAQALKIIKLREGVWVSPRTRGKNGLFLEENWQDLNDFLLKEKQIAEPVPTSRMYTNALIDEINKYDKASVTRQAKEFDLKSVQ